MREKKIVIGQKVSSSQKVSSGRRYYLVCAGILLLCAGIAGVIIYAYTNGSSITTDTNSSSITDTNGSSITTDNKVKILCSPNDGTMFGWYHSDDNVCLYETKSNRRQLFVGSLYRSLPIPKFNGAYWAIDQSSVAHNVLPDSLINSNCTSMSTHPSCQMYFWEREINGTVVDLTNPNGTSILNFIKKRVQGEGLWEDFMSYRDIKQRLPDFCDKAINTEEAKRYIQKYPSALYSLSTVNINVYNASIESHRMLCNVVEYPYYPNTEFRGPTDGLRLLNVFAIVIVDNTVYYTYGCSAGTGRKLTARDYKPVYLAMLTQLYTRYVSNIDYDVTFNYTSKNYSDYPGTSEIECVSIEVSDSELESGSG